MSRITAAAELTRDELADAPDEGWIDTLLEKDNQLGRQVVSNINQNLPFLNCPTSQLNEPLQMVHGVPLTIKNPLNTPIRSVMAVACIGLSVDSSGKPTRGTYNLGLPQLEWHPSGKEDGSVVVTANFPLPVSEQIELARTTASANYTTGIEANVIWSGICTGNTRNETGVYSFDGTSTLTVLQAGEYTICAQFAFAFNATGRRNGIIHINGSEVAEDARLTCPSGSTVFQVSLPITLAAGDTVLARARQDSGGNLTLNGSGTLASALANRTRLTVTRIRNNETPTGKVTLFFAGGE